MTAARFQWIVIAIAAFSVCGVACRFKRATANSEKKELILSRFALCVSHDIPLFSSSIVTAPPNQADDNWTIGKIREYVHDAGRDISEDKAKQLLLQAKADYTNGAFKREDCIQYEEDFTAFQKEAAEATKANATSH